MTEGRIGFAIAGSGMGAVTHTIGPHHNEDAVLVRLDRAAQ